MSEQFEGFTTVTVESWEQGMEAMDRLFQATQPETVFGKPVEAQGQTVITASEVSMGLGFGFGGGAGGDEPDAKEGEGLDESSAESEVEGQQEGHLSVGGGMGGGGGGASSGRPVAVICIGPDGVKVEPIVDVTKIALAFFTALGSMFFMAKRMQRAGRK